MTRPPARASARPSTQALHPARDAVGVRLAGRGGQGIMLAGFLLAQAAMTDGLHVVQTQSYGPEARLGAAKSDVIVSASEIAYPEVLAPDFFVCLSHDAYVAYSHTIGPGAVSVIEERAVGGLDGSGHPSTPDAIVLPLADTARDCGTALATNIVALGALVTIADIVSERSMREAIADRVAPESLALNANAFEAGLRLAAAWRESLAAHAAAE